MGDENVQEHGRQGTGWRTVFKRKRPELAQQSHHSSTSGSEHETTAKRPDKWSMGMLNDKQTEEVPGSVLLLSKVSEYNEPLGLRHAPARTSASSLPSPYSPRSSTSRRSRPPEKKRTADGKIILEPQPTDSANDPLNWPVIRRDLSLISLGFYCLLGGGMTTVLAAGFNAVSVDLNVSVPQVALTTGLYMMGLGLGSVVLSPTAILYGKRPVYLAAATCFVISNIWCALSPTFASLLVARIFMGFAVSSVECLPSASIAEIYFLHEKAYRLGIYTLLLLGGKNLVPLVSAAVVQSLGWRWVFWIVAIIVGFAGVLLFLFVPETFWDRSPKPHTRHVLKSRSIPRLKPLQTSTDYPDAGLDDGMSPLPADTIAKRRAATRHIHFDSEKEQAVEGDGLEKQGEKAKITPIDSHVERDAEKDALEHAGKQVDTSDSRVQPDTASRIAEEGSGSAAEHGPSQGHPGKGHDNTSELDDRHGNDFFTQAATAHDDHFATSPLSASVHDLEAQHGPLPSPGGNPYTKELATLPPQTFVKSLRPFSGHRLSNDKWLRVMVRPFILFAYPSILWSALVYALSVGWLIVLSESVASIFENRNTYNFTPLQVGLVYISPFIGGVLGSAVAGKFSDLIVRFMARRNGGIYEPEFRLVMAIPIAITTVIGLMGYGWSVEERDSWIVPTIFFAFISFGCTMGSTTAITFAVDSYRQYAGEALVTLNFSKNILHGLVWSLFFNEWLSADGSKTVFVAIGGIQLACLLTTIPMYVYGKRGRMWTVRRDLMEKF